MSGAKFDQTVSEEVQIHSAALPPAEMPSCMNLFDKWATCFGAFPSLLLSIDFQLTPPCFGTALGPQARFIYRYGSFTDCKDKLEDFKFCLTMRGISAEERRDRWLQRKAEKTAAKRLTSSSEDVWEMRREPLVDPAFIQQQAKT